MGDVLEVSICSEAGDMRDIRPRPPGDTIISCPSPQSRKIRFPSRNTQKKPKKQIFSPLLLGKRGILLIFPIQNKTTI
jgi:hypothetical protein